MNKPILLTGFRPTGDLHLGHYFSLIDPIIRNHKDFQIFVLVADLHALTEFRKTNQIDYARFKNEIRLHTDSALDIISQFVDINELVIFRQSDLMTYHYDLFYKLLMLSRHTLTFGNPVFIDAMKGEYERDIDTLKLEPHVKKVLKEFADQAPELLWGNLSRHIVDDMIDFLLRNGITLTRQSVDKIVKSLNTRIGVAGFATYPILMAADIMLYSPEYVLVGTDQAPHIQITNDLVKIMNNTFGITLDRVKPMIDCAQTLKGNDGRKMSKTFDNHLPLGYLLQTETEPGNAWVMKLKTFSRLRGQPGQHAECLTGEYSRLFGVNAGSLDLCSTGAIGCVECKRNLFDEIHAHIINKKRFEAARNTDEILSRGKDDAEARIKQNLQLLDILK